MHVRRVKRRVASATLAYLLTLLAPAVANAGCGDGPYAECFNAESLWVDPFPGPGIATNAAWYPQPDYHAGLNASYQRSPLTAVLASPDPYGSNVDLMEHWWTAQAFASTRLGPIDIGLNVPVAFGSAGVGSAALSTRGAERSVAGFGDPRVAARFVHPTAIGSLAVIQELSLPIGADASLMTARSLTYAPRVSLGWKFSRWHAAVDVGLRLRRPARFGSVSFGSELSLAASAGYALGRDFEAFLETWATPALSRSEVRWPDGFSEVRRFPAEVMLGAARGFGPLRGHLGFGSSLPLTRERTEAGTQYFSGPPGPRLRVSAQVEVEW